MGTMEQDRVVPRVGARMVRAVIAGLGGRAPAPARGLALRELMVRTVQRVADRHGVTVADLRGRAKGKAIWAARNEAFAALRDRLPVTQAQIGRFFDGRDHSTIHDGIAQHRARVQRRAEVLAQWGAS
jgi:chromosomal replication initiation ATPase DnaA